MIDGKEKPAKSGHGPRKLFPRKVKHPIVSAHEIAKLPVHPLADSFQIESEENLRLLAEDMRVNGQVHPIIVCGGQLVDGRNRLKAAIMANRKVKVEYRSKMSEDEIRSLILSVNVKRRNRTAKELAALALDYYDKCKEQGHKVSLQNAASDYNVAKRTLDRLIAKRKGKETTNDRYGPQEIRIKDIPDVFRPMLEALVSMWKFKEYGKGFNCQYRKFMSKILLLAQKILSQGEMQGIKREIDWAKELATDDDDDDDVDVDDDDDDLMQCSAQ